MGWFQIWWQGIGLVGQIMACAAIPTTLVLLLQAILMLFGAGFGSDSDGMDSDGADVGIDGHDGHDFDPHFDGDYAISDDVSEGMGVGEGEGASDGVSDRGSDSNTIRIITIRGIIAFFAVGGWAGLAALTAGIPTIWSVQIALLSGAAALLLASLVLRLALRMQSSGNINLRNAISGTAEVYIKIPPMRAATGKVMMLLQERYVEIDAVTDHDTELRPNTQVEVVGLLDSDCLIVRPVVQQEEENGDYNNKEEY